MYIIHTYTDVYVRIYMYIFHYYQWFQEFTGDLGTYHPHICMYVCILIKETHMRYI